MPTTSCGLAPADQSCLWYSELSKWAVRWPIYVRAYSYISGTRMSDNSRVAEELFSFFVSALPGYADKCLLSLPGSFSLISLVSASDSPESVYSYVSLLVRHTQCAHNHCPFLFNCVVTQRSIRSGTKGSALHLSPVTAVSVGGGSAYTLNINREEL